jgi:hypothetical protein
MMVREKVRRAVAAAEIQESDRDLENSRFLSVTYGSSVKFI